MTPPPWRRRKCSAYIPVIPTVVETLDCQLGSGTGTELHNQLHRLGMPECQTCRVLAHRMNEWGVAGCREHFDAIVTDILPRARGWWNNTDYRQKLRAWWKSNPTLFASIGHAAKLAGAQLDELLRDVIRQQVETAIEQAEGKFP